MELGGTPSDQYAGYVVEDSDLEYSECSEGESSEDESCSRPPRPNDPHESSEDEFEKEMDSEIMNTLELMVSPTALVVSKDKSRQSLSRGASGSGSAMESSRNKGEELSHKAATKKEKEEYYDEVYFDSSSGSEDEGGGKKKMKKEGNKVRKLTNDELFYDPLMDEEDEKWVKRQRMAYHNVRVSRELEQKKSKKQQPSQSESAGSSSSKPAGEKESHHKTELVVPRSDAVLNCPACMTTLCLDCQRHDFYVNQYRAMFVMNCCVVRDEVLTYMPKPDKKSRKRKNRKSKGEQTAQTTEEPEKYNPVRCSECNTEVAVFDKDEVFHFFNVLASAA